MGITTSMLLAAAAVTAVGAVAGGIDADKQASFKAADQRQQGEREREIAEADEDDFRRQQSRVAASSRAAGGQSGVDQSSGSALLAKLDYEAEVELNALRIRAGGDTSQARANTQAALTSAAGKSAKNRGFIRAGSSLLSGGANTFIS
tara:strand:+ start:465 stop:908 length:444 start_codon:yes stop_codon:yes gene_type:complete